MALAVTGDRVVGETAVPIWKEQTSEWLISTTVTLSTPFLVKLMTSGSYQVFKPAASMPSLMDRYIATELSCPFVCVESFLLL